MPQPHFWNRKIDTVVESQSTLSGWLTQSRIKCCLDKQNKIKVALQTRQQKLGSKKNKTAKAGETIIWIFTNTIY
jgi:hypothetical protein